VLWKLCHGQILAPVGASSSSSVGTSMSVASSASVAAVSASAVATAGGSALGLVVVPPAWRFGTVAVAVAAAVAVASPVGMSASASAPFSTGGCCGGLAFCLGFKGDFLLAFGGFSFSGAILGVLEPEALVGSFVEALALGLGLCLAVVALPGTEMERAFMRYSSLKLVALCEFLK